MLVAPPTVESFAAAAELLGCGGLECGAAENVSSAKVAATSCFSLPAAAFCEAAARVGVGGGVLGEGPECRGVTASVITTIKFTSLALLLPAASLLPQCIVVTD